jgi:hypothetical protein
LGLTRLRPTTNGRGVAPTPGRYDFAGIKNDAHVALVKRAVACG